jgi:hypothetical protein
MVLSSGYQLLPVEARVTCRSESRHGNLARSASNSQCLDFGSLKMRREVNRDKVLAGCGMFVVGGVQCNALAIQTQPPSDKVGQERQVRRVHNCTF